MDIVADFLLASGAFGAAVYCCILSMRLRKFSTLEGGLGGAIAVLSAQVDDMTRTLETARATAGGSASHLEALTERAEAAAAKLELLVASMHDLPETRPPVAAEAPADLRKVRFIRRGSRSATAGALE